MDVSIFDKVEAIIDKLFRRDQNDMIKYLNYKLYYCMGKMQALDLKKSIASYRLKNDS